LSLRTRQQPLEGANPVDVDRDRATLGFAVAYAIHTLD
jgi:hypothetical protein